MERNQIERIVAISGEGSSGKTSTVILLKTELMRLYPSSKPNDFMVALNKALKRKYKRKEEILCTFKIGDKLIGLASEGDSKDVLEKSFDILCAQKCNLIICCMRTGGETYKFIQDYTWISNVWVKLSVSTEDVLKRDIRNKKNTDEIIEYIEKML